MNPIRLFWLGVLALVIAYAVPVMIVGLIREPSLGLFPAVALVTLRVGFLRD